MVLLLYTQALESRLAPLAALLPPELVAQIAFHLDSSTPTETTVEEAARPEVQQPKAFERAVNAQEERTIGHEAVVGISKWVRGEGRDAVQQVDGTEPDSYRLSNLLQLTEVYAPPIKPREKSPELLAILSRIQLEQDRVAYSHLTSLDPPSHRSLLPLNDRHDPHQHPLLSGGVAQPGERTVAQEWNEIKRELGAIVNVLASMMAVGTAVWWVGGGRSYAARLGLAMLGAVSIALIEGFLYWRFFSRLEAAKVDARKRKRKGGSDALATATAGAGANGVLKFEKGIAGVTKEGRVVRVSEKKGGKVTKGT
ncbi:hypothetical protein JCM10212_002106 [Sporobolomyces blumeae]